MGRPRLSRLQLWKERHDLLEEIVTEAVQRLHGRALPLAETEINKILQFEIHTVIHERGRRGLETCDFMPAADGLNTAVAPDEQGPENKRPDFQWVLMDHAASDVALASRP